MNLFFEMKRRLIAAGIFFLSASFYARTLSSFVGAEKAKRLLSLSEKAVIDFHNDKSDEFVLLPNSRFSDEIKTNAFCGCENYFIECLYFVSDEDLLKQSNKKEMDESMQRVSIIVRSISKMQGMKYRTEENGNEKILYKRTYTMSGKDDDREVPDKIEGSADGLCIYAFQHDRVFGPCKYEVRYRESSDEIYMTFMNLTPMNFGLLKSIDKEKFRSNMLISKCGEGFLVYIAAQTVAKRMPFLTKSVNKMFYGRLQALYQWFCGQF